MENCQNFQIQTDAECQVTDSYNFENRLVNRNNGQIQIVYDGDGNRVMETVNGVTTAYLVDDLNPQRLLAETSETKPVLLIMRKKGETTFLLRKEGCAGPASFGGRIRDCKYLQCRILLNAGSRRFWRM